MPSITLGFAEPTSPWTLLSHIFPDKIGGRPAWLALKHLPSPADIACPYCQEPMVFLLQLYSPIDDNPACFHRMIFVFMCKSGTCYTTETRVTPFRVFRSQLPRKNSYYSADPPKDEESHSSLETTVCALKDEKLPMPSKFSLLCPICGCFGDKSCGICKKVAYCSKAHQALHWKAIHKRKCPQYSPFDELFTTNDFLLPEFALSSEQIEENVIIDNDTDDDEEEDDDNDGDGDTNTNHTLSSADNAEFAALEGISRKETKEERKFTKFKEIMKPEPDQVVRFNRGKSPFWVSLHPMEIPVCGKCGGKRIFEFQITPQILSYLKLDRIGEACPDFATVYIFTCEQSCTPESSAEYVEEFVAFNRVP